MICERMVLLDHLSHGRAILGLGPGALLKYDGRVTMKTDWFELQDACLQLRPDQESGMEIVVTALTSAAGPALAGRLGMSMLSLSAGDAIAAGVLGKHWSIVEEQAVEHGTIVSRRNWRLTTPMHIAETWAHDWAANDATMRSFELFAHHVMPAFQNQTESMIDAEHWLGLHSEEGFRKATGPRPVHRRLRGKPRHQEADGFHGMRASCSCSLT
jgi:limonene 1,2-monooxygenase